MHFYLKKSTAVQIKHNAHEGSTLALKNIFAVHPLKMKYTQTYNWGKNEAGHWKRSWYQNERLPSESAWNCWHRKCLKWASMHYLARKSMSEKAVPWSVLQLLTVDKKKQMQNDNSMQCLTMFVILCQFETMDEILISTTHLSQNSGQRKVCWRRQRPFWRVGRWWPLFFGFPPKII